MGIDAMIYVKSVTDEQVDAARKYLAARDPSWRIRRSEYADWAMLDTAWRYYGPGYERGPWPEIYGGIRGMMGAFPGCDVYYHGDSDDEDYATPVTTADLDAIWQHWTGPNGDEYRREIYGRRA